MRVYKAFKYREMCIKTIVIAHRHFDEFPIYCLSIHKSIWITYKYHHWILIKTSGLKVNIEKVSHNQNLLLSLSKLRYSTNTFHRIVFPERVFARDGRSFTQKILICVCITVFHNVFNALGHPGSADCSLRPQLGHRFPLLLQTLLTFVDYIRHCVLKWNNKIRTFEHQKLLTLVMYFTNETLTINHATLQAFLWLWDLVQVLCCIYVCNNCIYPSKLTFD